LDNNLDANIESLNIDDNFYDNVNKKFDRDLDNNLDANVESLDDFDDNVNEKFNRDLDNNLDANVESLDLNNDFDDNVNEKFDRDFDSSPILSEVDAEQHIKAYAIKYGFATRLSHTDKILEFLIKAKIVCCRARAP
ncbi:13279_t:CDS:2, partial [Racocetra fulgida]